MTLYRQTTTNEIHGNMRNLKFNQKQKNGKWPTKFPSGDNDNKTTLRITKVVTNKTSGREGREWNPSFNPQNGKLHLAYVVCYVNTLDSQV